MKAILLSIKPESVAKILNGEKTIEVRKTAPKCDLPVTVYVYCTKGQEELYEAFTPLGEKAPYQSKPKGIGLTGGVLKQGNHLNGKVVARFTLRKVEKLEYHVGCIIPQSLFHTDFIQARHSMEKKSCLSMDEIWDYTNGKGYAWHITDLVIFDKPKGLDEFGLNKTLKNWFFLEEENEIH